MFLLQLLSEPLLKSERNKWEFTDLYVNYLILWGPIWLNFTLLDKF